MSVFHVRKYMSTYWKCFAIVLGLLLLAGVWLYRLEEQASFITASPVPARAIVVTVTAVEEGTVTQWIVGEGYAQAISKAYLQFEEAGSVVFIAKDSEGVALREGARVHGPLLAKKGQVLARIDTRDEYSEIRQAEAVVNEARQDITAQQAALTQAEAELAEAEQNLHRKKLLFAKNYIPRSELDQAINAHVSALAAVSMAKDHVASAKSRFSGAEVALSKAVRGPERGTLYAPFSGVIARINIREGDYFDPDSVVHADKARLLETAPVTLLDPSQMEVTLYLPEYTGRAVAVGQQVLLAPATGGLSEHNGSSATRRTGIVYSVSPQIDAAKRAVRIKVRFTQEVPTDVVPGAFIAATGEEVVIPDGQYTTCWIAAAQALAAVRIPLAALQFTGERPYVYVVCEGIAQKRFVTLGIQNSRYAAVEEGLSKGEQVVSLGAEVLMDGVPVRIIPPAPAAGVHNADK